MNKEPHIKILVLNWNGANIIEECLSSLKKIDYKNYSIDVIDNGSSDNSISIIEKNFSDINLHIIKKNLGYSRGYNSIFKELNSNNFDYYLLLNNDVYVDKNILKVLVYKINELGADNIYGPKINYSDDLEKVWYAGGYFNKYLGFAKHIGINKYEKNIKYKTTQTAYVSGCCMLINKDLINTLDGFDDSFKMYYEDVDLCYRASCLGIKCFFIQDAIIYHKVSYSIGNNTFKKRIRKFLSQIKFIYYHNNIILFIISLFINLVLLPFSLILLCIKK